MPVSVRAASTVVNVATVASVIQTPSLTSCVRRAAVMSKSLREPNQMRQNGSRTPAIPAVRSRLRVPAFHLSSAARRRYEGAHEQTHMSGHRTRRG